MVKDGLVVSASFKAIAPTPVTKYAVTIGTLENGTIVSNVTEAEVGAEVILTVTPTEGFELTSLLVNEVEKVGDVVEQKLVVKMVKDGLSINGVFTKIVKYNVTSEVGTHGTFTLDKSSAREGEEVTISITPEEGYYAKSYTLTTTEGSSVVAISGNGKTVKFTVGKLDVKVSVLFAKDITYTILVNKDDNCQTTASRSIAHEGDEIKVTFALTTGYELASFLVNEEERILQVKNNEITLVMGSENMVLEPFALGTSLSVDNFSAILDKTSVENSSISYGSSIVITKNQWGDNQTILGYTNLIDENGNIQVRSQEKSQFSDEISYLGKNNDKYYKLVVDNANIVESYDDSLAKEDIEGPKYSLFDTPWSWNSTKVSGSTNALLGLYKLGKDASSLNFKEFKRVDPSDESSVYYFSFSKTINDQKYRVYNVEFRLYSNGAIVQSAVNIYEYSDFTVNPIDGSVVINDYKINETTKVYTTNTLGEKYKSTIKLSDKYFKELDLEVLKDDVVLANDRLEWGTSYSLKFSDPSEPYNMYASLKVDKPTFTVTAGEKENVSIDDSSLSFSAKGTYTVSMKLRDITKEFTFVVADPVVSGISINMINSEGYFDTISQEGISSYIGLETILAPEFEPFNADQDFNYSVTKGPKDDLTLVKGVHTLETGVSKNVLKVNCSVEGMYEITFTSVSNPSISKAVMITYFTKPTLKQYLTDNSFLYKKDGNINNTIKFFPSSEDGLKGDVLITNTLLTENNIQSASYVGVLDDATGLITMTLTTADGPVITETIKIDKFLNVSINIEGRGGPQDVKLVIDDILARLTINWTVTYRGLKYSLSFNENGEASLNAMSDTDYFSIDFHWSMTSTPTGTSFTFEYRDTDNVKQATDMHFASETNKTGWSFDIELNKFVKLYLINEGGGEELVTFLPENTGN